MKLRIGLYVLSCLSYNVALGQSVWSSQLEERDNNVTYHNGVYFTNWGIYSTDFQPASLPASRLSHVYYAFANILTSGEVISSDPYADLEKRYPSDCNERGTTNAYGCVKQMYLLKKANRGLKVLLSIGGWTYSSAFSAAASTNASRATFASSAVSLMIDWGFDGIDIDWEWQNPPPNKSDVDNYVLLLKSIRSALDKVIVRSCQKYHFLLTIAAPAGPVTYKALNLKDMAGYVDFFNLMSYDYTGSFSAFSGHQANLYPNPDNLRATPFSTDQAVKDYAQAGVPANKIVMGMPAYGRYFSGTAGLGQPFGMTNDSSDVYRYNILPKSGSSEMNDKIAGASYSYDSVSGELVSYDTPASVQDKIAYIESNGLRGCVFWEASGDRRDDGSLIATSFTTLNQIDTSLNLLEYPDSRYANIAAGMPSVSL